MRTLTALAVKNAKPGDKLGDGDGLRLDVDKSGNRSWVFRFTSPTTGKERYAGFGSADVVTLAEAREIWMEKRQAPPTMAEQPSRLRLASHWPVGGCRR